MYLEVCRFARRGMQDGCAAVREESDSDTSKEAMQIDSPHPRYCPVLYYFLKDKDVCAC